MNRLRFALLIGLIVALAGCSAPQIAPEPGVPDTAPEAQIDLPAQCRGDGAPQTWLLLPLDPPETDLTTAYRAGQVIEFQARVVGQDDDPARAPHRRFILAEAAEGITLTLDYQGDPPPLAVDQSYRLVAWADISSGSLSPVPADTATPAAQTLPDARSYGLQIFDDAGLLFLGLTDTDLRDDPLDIELTNVDGECPAVPVSSNPCVASRQVLPLEVRWRNETITLYPGEDDLLSHSGALYEVSLFRNRNLQYSEPACAGYNELTRSLRIERLDPPPVIIPPPTVTGTVTSTLPLTATEPLTGTAPSTATP